MCYFLANFKLIDNIYAVLFLFILPTAVLVINVVVAIQVRRAAIHAAANLGVHPHHQSMSAVPTVMLITTSLIYVLLNTMRGITYVMWLWVTHNYVSLESREFVMKCYFVSFALSRLVFAYNFYIYLITGKQFRSDLEKLLCRCSSSSSSAHAHAHAAAAAANDDAEVARRVRADTAV